MKIKLFVEKDSEEAERAANEWLEKNASMILINDRQVALSNVGKSHDGSHQNILVAIWYTTASNTARRGR